VGVAPCQELDLFGNRHDPQQVGHGDDGGGLRGCEDGSEAPVFHEGQGTHLCGCEPSHLAAIKQARSGVGEVGLA